MSFVRRSRKEVHSGILPVCRSFDIGQMPASFFGIEPGDFLFLVEKRYHAVEQHIDIDSFIGKGSVGRFLGDLKEVPSKVTVLSLATGALLFETQSLFNLISYLQSNLLSD